MSVIEFLNPLVYRRGMVSQGAKDLFTQAKEFYTEGEDRSKDAKAFGIFAEASKAGCIKAEYYMGRMLDKGYGVDQDYEKAYSHYSVAADHGNPDAIFSIGVLYYYGHFVEQSYDKAFGYFMKAADLGNPKAVYNLGVMYDSGIGVE